MASAGIAHDENSPSCHHCHITSPIPLSELIRTHPLRAVLAKKNEELTKAVEDAFALPEAQEKKKTDSLRSYAGKLKTHNQSDAPFKKHPTKSNTTRSGGSSSSRRPKSEEPTLVRPVHSFLHHESEISVYKAPPNPSTSDKASSHIPDPYLTTSSTSTEEDNQPPSPPLPPLPPRAHSLSRSPDLILNAKNLEIHKESIQNKSNSSTFIRKIKEYKILRLKDEETQTPRESVISKASYSKSRNSSSELSSISFIKTFRKRRKNCNVFICSLPSGLLFAGYGLLIVIGIVVAVALSQRERRITLQSSPIPRRQQAFPGAVVEFEPNNQRIARPRVAQASRNRIRPIPRLSPQEHVIPAPVQPQPHAQPQPQPQAPPQQEFKDEDFDYIAEAGFDDADFTFPNQNAPKPAPVPLPAFRPLPVQAPAQEVRIVAQAPRQQAPRRGGTPSTFQQEFSLSPQQGEEVPRGQKEPEVKIVKSWSNRNADGTFSWGFLNTDGSFKNETRGIDCVVRGIYGYVDETTGEPLTFPYESGNPCDPNEPDYLVDYDEGVNLKQKLNAANLPRRRPS